MKKDTFQKDTLAPLLGWLDEIAKEDGFLASMAHPLFQEEEAWSWAVAAGRMARLQQPERGKAARDIVAQLLQGIAPAPKPAYLWAQTWTPEERAVLLEKAQEQLAQLLEQLAAWDAALDDEALFDPSNTALAELVQKALYLRDDLESVLILLRAKEELPDALQAPLRQADRQGRILSRSLPTLSTLAEDPRLQRILSASPDAWWAYPVAETVLFADGRLVAKGGKEAPLQADEKNEEAVSLDEPDRLAQLPASYQGLPLILWTTPLQQRAYAPAAQSSTMEFALHRDGSFTLAQTPLEGLIEMELARDPQAEGREIAIFLEETLLYQGSQPRILLDLRAFSSPQGRINLHSLTDLLRVEWK